MGNNPGKGGNALRLSGRDDEEARKVTIKLKDESSVTLENVCQLYAERYRTDREDSATLLGVIENNFDRLLRTKERRQSFLQLPKEAILHIIKSDDLYAANEYTILVLVGAWVDHQVMKELKKKTKTRTKNESEKEKEVPEEKALDPWEPEEEERRKQVKEDAMLAALLQKEGGNVDPSKLSEGEDVELEVLDAETVHKFLTNLNGVAIPAIRCSQKYDDKLRAGIAEFAEYIRFPTMSHHYLQMVMDDGIVPEKYIHEAIRYHAMQIQDDDFYKKMRNSNPRFKPRSHHFSLVWDPKKKDNRLQVSEDGLTVTVIAGTSCAHKAVIGKDPIVRGRAIWEVTLNQYAGCTDAIGVVNTKFKVNADQMIGIFPNSWGISLYPGIHVPTSDRRIQPASPFGALRAGTKVKVVVDMDMGTIEFFINGSPSGKLKGLKGPLYPALTMCEVTGSGITVTQEI